MTAKEKAIEIVKQFKGFEMPNEEIASVQCAIIHVERIIERFENMRYRTNIGGVISYEGGQLIDEIQYWRDVLTELNQM